MTRTLGQALRETTQRLAASANARVEAEELLSRLLALTRVELTLERERALGAEDERRLDAWIERRLTGEPLQYICGRAAFRGLDLAVSRAVLIPRPETEGLVEAVLETLRAEAGRWPAPRVLDLGTGSGAIALAIASEWPAARVTATDEAAAALEVARHNVERLGLMTRVSVLDGAWFDAVDPEARFEVVVSNPPYVATSEWDLLPHEVRAFEPSSALFAGPTGLEALREIVDLAPRHLVAGGLLALELAEMRAREVAAWLDGARDWEEVELRDDLAGRPRVLLARRQRGPAIAPAQWGEA